MDQEVGVLRIVSRLQRLLLFREVRGVLRAVLDEAVLGRQ